MNDEEIDRFRQKLLDLKADLQNQEAASKAAASAEPAQADSTDVSRKDAMHAHLVAQEPARRRQRQLGKIEGALRRIKAGDYGNCFVCGDEIEADRLLEDPTNTRCLKCVES